MNLVEKFMRFILFFEKKYLVEVGSILSLYANNTGYRARERERKKERGGRVFNLRYRLIRLRSK